MHIEYSGALTKQEIHKAIYLHQPRLKSSKWLFWTMLAATIVMFLIVLANPDNKSIGAFRDQLSCLVIFTLLSAVILAAPRMYALSLTQKGSIYSGNIYGVINEFGVTINGNESVRTLDWKTIESCKYSTDMLLLYQNKKEFYIFTSSMFSSLQNWENCIASVKSRIPNE